MPEPVGLSLRWPTLRRLQAMELAVARDKATRHARGHQEEKRDIAAQSGLAALGAWADYRLVDEPLFDCVELGGPEREHSASTFHQSKEVFHHFVFAVDEGT